MNINVLNSENNIVGNFDLSFLNVKVLRKDIIRRVILWQRSVNRVSIASTKSVSEISGSTKKLYRQKGSGRARHGARRRNIFVGGAIAFGPKLEKKYSFFLNKKLRKLALRYSILLMAQSKNLLIYNNLTLATNKTNYFIKTYSFIKRRKILFVDETFEKNFYLSCRNIPNVNMLVTSGINSYDIVASDKICFSMGSLIKLKEVLLRC